MVGEFRTETNSLPNSSLEMILFNLPSLHKIIVYSKVFEKIKKIWKINTFYAIFGNSGLRGHWIHFEAIKIMKNESIIMVFGRFDSVLCFDVENLKNDLKSKKKWENTVFFLWNKNKFKMIKCKQSLVLGCLELHSFEITTT